MRMLSCASFFSNSNRMGLKSDRSYSVRSAESTNCSASASVRKVGMVLREFGLLTVCDFLAVHVSGRDGADSRAAFDGSECEGDEEVSAHRVAAYAVEALFGVAGPVGSNQGFIA